MPMYCHRITVSYFKRISSNRKNIFVTINDIDDTTLYHETVNVQLRPSSDLSDILQVFEVDDIFTRKDAISGLKNSLWVGLGKLVNTPLDSSIFGI